MTASETPSTSQPPHETARPADANSPAPRRWYVPDVDMLIARIATGVFFLSIFFSYPFTDVYEFDPDEGNRMMIAKLASEGHHLYSEIWNDQPPLMTYLLRGWCDIFGWNVNAARVLTLIIVSVMAFAGYDAIRTTFASSGKLSGRIAGHVGGLVWMLLLPLVDQFLRLSVSAMVGLPSIALAVLSVWAIVRWSVSRRQSWLIGSAIFMGCSLMIKAFTGFLLPILGLAVLITAFVSLYKQAPAWKAIIPPAIWSVVVIGFCGVLILATVPMSNIDQLYKPHAAGAQVDIGGGSNNPSLARLNSYLSFERGEGYLLVLAGIGAVAAAFRQKWSLLVFAAWVIVGYVALRNHAPIWYHHAVLVTIPAALLAAVIIAAIIDAAWPFRLKLTNLATLAVGIAGVVYFGVLLNQFFSQRHPTFAEMREAETAKHRFYTALVEEIQKLNPDNNVIVTDRQMYALNAGLDVPPNFGLTTSKRVDTGNFTTADVLSAVDKYHPNQIVLVRAVLKALGQDIKQAISADYQPLLDLGNEAAIYIKRDIFPADPTSVLLAAANDTPDAGFAWLLIGQQQLQSGQTAAGMESFEHALAGQLDPRSFAQAAPYYIQQRVVSRDPAVHNPAKAEPVLAKLNALYRGHPPVWYYELATMVAAAQNKRAAAIEHARQGLQIAQQTNDTTATQRLNDMLRQLQQ